MKTKDWYKNRNRIYYLISKKSKKNIKFKSKFKFKLIIIYLLINNVYYIIFLINFHKKEQEYITYILRVKSRKFHFRVKYWIYAKLTKVRIDLVSLEIGNGLEGVVEALISIIAHRVQGRQIGRIEWISGSLIPRIIIKPDSLVFVPEDVVDGSLIVYGDLGITPGLLEWEGGKRGGLK